MPKTDTVTLNLNQEEILNDGVNWLREKLGDVGTEAFISIIIREKFDYTKWRRQFFGDKTVSEINEEAAEYSRNHPFTPKKPQVPIQRNS